LEGTLSWKGISIFALASVISISLAISEERKISATGFNFSRIVF